MIFLSDILYELDGTYIINDCKIFRDNMYAGMLLKNFKPSENSRFNMYVPIYKRKMLFLKNIEKLPNGTIYTTPNSAKDILYDSPNYLVDEFSMVEKKEDLYISKTVYLGKLLEHFNFNEELSKSDIRKVYKLFLTYNSKFFTENHSYLPISKEDFNTLKMISEMPRVPSLEETKKFDNSFNPKVKIYTRK